MVGVPELPKAIVLDFGSVNLLDLTGVWELFYVYDVFVCACKCMCSYMHNLSLFLSLLIRILFIFLRYSGLINITDILFDTRRKDILILIINASLDIQKMLRKFGIKNDVSTDDVDLSMYAELYGIIPFNQVSSERNGESESVLVGIEVSKLNRNEEKEDKIHHIEEGLTVLKKL